MRHVLGAFGASALLLATATASSAQLPQASSATLDRGLDPTAVGGGFAAIASNPAGLAHTDRPGFSLALPSVSALAGVGPVRWRDFIEWEGRLVPETVKDEWMARIRAGNGQAVRVGSGVTPLALTIGPFGIQVSNRTGGRATLSPGGAELLLYGNAGRTGEPSDFDLSGSTIEGFSVSTAALSFGLRLTNRILLGATGKYILGHGLAIARDAGSFITGDPISVELDFPLMMPDADGYRYDEQGDGLGVDLGVIWDGGPLRLGVTVENAFDTFEWRLDRYVYRPGQALFNEDERESDFDEVPLSEAPQDVREEFLALADEFDLEQRIAVGASLEAHRTLRFFGNVQKGLTDGMSFDPDFYGGVGLEWSPLSFLPLRAHGAVVTDGYQLGGGASMVLGPLHLSGGIGMRSDSTQDSLLGTFTLSFGSH